MIKVLFEKSIRKIMETDLSFERFLMSKINWNHKLISIIGSRGVGKTTLVLQFLKKNKLKDDEKLYISLDDIYFSKHRLVDLAAEFVKLGGKLLVLDEVHKYPDWSIEIKNIYDDYLDLHVVFTGSSILEIDKGNGDLSRRAINYSLPIMSFREFLSFETGRSFKIYDISQIIEHHLDIAKELNSLIKPIKFYQKYIQYGAYPYYKTTGNEYWNQLVKTIQVVLESDLPAIIKIDYLHIIKLKKLLLLIAECVPFKPNITELSAKTGITRDTVLVYLDYLQKAQLVSLLTAQNKGFRRFEKPEKIYLDNCNQLFALSLITPNKGTLRETFFLQHTNIILPVNYSNKGDFLVSEKYTFEIGGKNKDYGQIANLENSFVAADDIEFGFKNKIPLWLFGFLY